MRFEFATATRILFGPGVVREVAPAAKGLGGRALLVIGCPMESAARLSDATKMDLPSGFLPATCRLAP
jgi:hypothetical protein